MSGRTGLYPQVEVTFEGPSVPSEQLRGLLGVFGEKYKYKSGRLRVSSSQAEAIAAVLEVALGNQCPPAPPECYDFFERSGTECDFIVFLEEDVQRQDVDPFAGTGAA